MPAHTTLPPNIIMRTSPIRRALLAAAAVACTTAALPSHAAAQQASSGNGAEFRWSKALQNGQLVRVANVTGDVAVIGADVEQVQVVARRRGSSSDTEARVEVKEHRDGITVCALRNEESYCDERGMHEDGNSGWARDRERARYDIEVRVPRRMRVSASTVSGDVRVAGTTLDVRATTVSGDATVEDVRAQDQVRVTSVSGDVTARLATLAQGTDMELKSVSGDIELSLPSTAGFTLSMSTVSGDLTSDFPLQMRGRFNRRSINATINNGGSDLDVSTVSGDVRIAHNRQD
jgi:hypothetical protein